MIVVQGLRKQFGAFSAVDGIDLEVGDGEVLALLGPNGAGKTTTIRMLASILQPTAGRAVVNGLDVVRDAPLVRRIVGLLTEVPGLYPRLTALDQLDYFGRLQGVPTAERRRSAETLLERFDLWPHRNRQVGSFSKGMKQKLALIRAVIHDPQVIFLDEPTSAMDPASARTVREYIGELRRQDRIVVVCTHNLVEAELLADRIAIIQHGRIVAHGTINDLKARLLGAYRYELRLESGGVALAATLNHGVLVDDFGETWVRFSTADPTRTNPVLLRDVVQGGYSVISLAELPRSLESIYLRIVEGGP